MRKKTFFLLIVLSSLMGLVEVFIARTYAIKALYKLVIFIGIPLLINHKSPFIDRDKLFKTRGKSIFLFLGLGLGIFLIIVLSYKLLGSFIDFSQVAGNLKDNMGVEKENFIYVALYISLINSFIEEFVFRGLGYLNLGDEKKLGWEGALIFSFYHLAIMRGWFNPLIFSLSLLALFIAGLFFNLLDRKSGNIYLSYTVHMFANLAINFIGYYYILT